ncbi:hypothetical protein MGG_17270 [Pyricularia oryzae 70-15]|uniref:Uncharacterized protein n=1 Tax=Pyricularia oryzae (strain 70-15 / ATCC MYA-4617 / FGSC 8958) TaxID=242507 RepID=G4NA13_PYRO7|nr:uncharacterized protein MGG_17270 [Pyricularia oryzae 70-15]EHA51259.1 hypothetical protein MGG_17270 [Pyricularia oryzae 70-15]
MTQHLKARLLHGTTRGGAHNEKRWVIKNCARVGPEGQTRTVDATVCNAGLPFSGSVFLITELGQQGAQDITTVENSSSSATRPSGGTSSSRHHQPEHSGRKVCSDTDMIDIKLD